MNEKINSKDELKDDAHELFNIKEQKKQIESLHDSIVTRIKNYLSSRIKKTKKDGWDFDYGDITLDCMLIPNESLDKTLLQNLKCFEKISIEVPTHREFSEDALKLALQNNQLTDKEIEEINKCKIIKEPTMRLNIKKSKGLKVNGDING
jgi:hypothetical protein